VSLLGINQTDQQALTPTNLDSPACVVSSSSGSGLLLLLLVLLDSASSSPEMVCASDRHTMWQAMNTVGNEAGKLMY
jgi:hypothetical protein